MIGREQRLPEQAEDAALWWATRRASDPERFAADGRFRLWLEDPANAQAWDRIVARDALIGSFASAPEIRAMRQEALALVRAARPRRRRWLAGGAMAASLALGLVTVASLSDPSSAPHASVSTASVRHYSTARGERREIRLADGSRISLNTETVVETRYNAGRRDVRLLSGQALFHVARDEDRPFVVAAGDRLITAIGTVFDIAVEPTGRVRVVLVEGQVRVDPARPDGLARILPALARDDLAPGQQMTVTANAAPVIGPGDVERSTAWNRGLVMLRDDRLSDAAAQFNRYAERPIIVADPVLGDLKVSGVFQTGRSEDFIAALEARYPIEATNESGSMRLQWRQTPDSPRR